LQKTGRGQHPAGIQWGEVSGNWTVGGVKLAETIAHTGRFSTPDIHFVVISFIPAADDVDDRPDATNVRPKTHGMRI